MLYKRTRTILAFLLTATLYLSPLLASDQVELPDLRARVNDYTSSLSSSQIAELETKISAFEEIKGAQIAIAIVPTTGALVIEDYAVKLQEKWKIGRKEINDGVLLVIAKDDHKLRIEVGYGLEGVIPDAIAKRIIEEIIVPQFKAGDFYQGIDLGVDNIIGLINGETLPPPSQVPNQDFDESIFIAFLLLIPAVTLQIHSMLKQAIGNLPSASLLSLGIGLVGYPFLPFSALFLIVLLIFLLLMLIRNSGGIYNNRSWGGSSGSSGGSSGGDDFSGGGGSSGGGGASGSW